MDDGEKTVLVIFHSASGNTERMTDSVCAGLGAAESGQLSWRRLHALEAEAADILKADGVILLTPENFGYMSGAMKYFFDRIYYPCLEKTQGLPYSLIIRAGNDGEGAKQSIERIVTGLRWREVAEPIISKGDFDEAVLAECRTLGESFALAVEAGIF
ncbi:MAG: NAD(P)H-dependent oxidoreductase [Pseudomonadota bacterium]